MSLRRRLIPYGLLAPGAIWLALFFVVPMFYMGELSLRSGTFDSGYTFSWDFSNYPDALEGRGEQILRTFYYAGAATLIGLLIAYPLAYAIAIRANPRWRLLMLFAVIAPLPIVATPVFVLLDAAVTETGEKKSLPVSPSPLTPMPPMRRPSLKRGALPPNHVMPFWLMNPRLPPRLGPGPSVQGLSVS